MRGKITGAGGRSDRRQPAVILAAALITVLPAGAARATTPVIPTAVAPTAPTPTAPTPTALTPAAPRRAESITLVTGDHVRVGTVGGKQRIETQAAARTGPGHRLLTYRLGTDTYVVPLTARPYLGRQLDRSLFDVTRLHDARRPDGRLPVRISYTGARPAVPGVTLTSVANGTATGYLTPASAAAFGTALAQRFTADEHAGFARRATLFTGVTRIAADLPAAGGVTPAYPMYTLRLTATDVTGAPVDSAFGILMNVDDGRRYGNFVDIEGGEARVSVPAGHYSLIGDIFEYDETTDEFRERLATVNEYTVAGAGQTLTLAFRGSTVRAGAVTTPKPATVTDYGFEWDRFDATGQSSISWGAGAGPGYALFLAPSAAATIGTLHVLQTWNANGPGEAYVFNLATQYTRIPADLAKTFRLADLATVRSTYFTDGPDRNAGFLRFPVYPWQFWVGGTFRDLKAPATRTEYVSGTGTPSWGESFIANNDSWDDPGFWDSNAWQPLPAGLSTKREWLRGALGPGIPVQSRPAGWNYCYACRTSHGISLALAPALDSSPDHSSEIFGSADGIPVTRFRFYQNGQLVSDRDDWLGGFFTVPSSTATYKAVLDVDRRLTDARQASRTSTELTFASAAGQGGALPSSWICDTGTATAATGCRVLPVVTAKLSLPTNSRGRLPAGKSTVTVTVARQQNAATATATSAGLEIRYPGWFWEPVTLKPAGPGTWTGVVDDTGLGGQDVDVRVSGADPAGSTFTQTILKAYTVAGS